MSGKAAELGAEDAWSDDGEEEMDDFVFFEEMEDEIDDEIDRFTEEPGPNTREQFEVWENEPAEDPLWEDEE